MLPPEDADPIVAAYRRVLELHETTAQQALSERSEPPTEPIWLGRAGRFAATLLAGDTRGALAMADEWVGERDDVAPFMELAATTAMIEIGRRWERGEISAAQEHLASALMNRVMAHLYPKIMESAPFRGRALVSCAANELHELGSRVFADLLELDGWDVAYLGANTPIEDLVAHVANEPVRVVALSVAMPFNLQNAARAVSEIRKLPLPRPRILLGGRAFSLAPDLWQQIGGDAYFPTAQAGVKAAREFSVHEG
jgi:methanogenic corrinoid protein MtbC1